jgi:hypothetical protein
MLEQIGEMVGNPVCTCCGAIALFQDRDSQTVLYCPVCATFAAKKTADVALNALLVILESRSSQQD